MTTAARAPALVTGAGRRIGRAIALALAGAGHDVAIHYRGSEGEAQAVADEIAALGRRAVLVRADLAVEDQARGVVADAAAALGPLGVLVNSASTFHDDRVGGLDRATWDGHFETNLRAPLVLAEAFAAQAPEGAPESAPGGAAIVNILDQRVLKPNPQFFSYALSKSALATATVMLAQALAPRIRVNGVAPGPTLASIHQDAALFAAEAAATPLGRPVDPDDIARAVLWLVDARSTTGQIIAVDAGQHLAWRTPDILEP